MISIIIPTIRKENIPNLLEAIKGAISVDHEVLWEEDIEKIGTPKMVKKLTDQAKYEWVVFLGDDTIPEKDSIDIIFKYANDKGLLLVGFNDHHGKKATHWIANKKLLSFLENDEFFFTGYIHNYCDDELRHRAEKLDTYGWCEEARITHNHPYFNSSISNVSYEKQMNKENWNHDKNLFSKRNCKISVVMIVKNEEVMLPRCLESVKNADEIIIVDTGSIDKTKEVATLGGAKVFDFEWCDDFSKARNFALLKATGDWVLSIDADEVLDENGIENIRLNLVTSEPVLGIHLKSIDNDFIVPRLFRRIPSIQWHGRIHETISFSQFKSIEVGITYYSSPAHILDPKRNIRMLEKAHKDNPTSTRDMFYLAREYAYYKEWDKAEEMFEKYLKIATWLKEKADAHFMLALCYWVDGKSNGEKCRENCLKAININANFKAPILLMANASFEKNAQQWNRMAESADNSDTLFERKRWDII